MSDTDAMIRRALSTSIRDAQSAEDPAQLQEALQWAGMLAQALDEERFTSETNEAHTAVMTGLARQGSAGSMVLSDINDVTHWIESRNDNMGPPDDLISRLGTAELKYRAGISSKMADGKKTSSREPELALDPTALDREIRMVLPEVTVRKIAPISGGYSKRTFLLEIVDNGVAGEWMLRQDMLGGPFGTSVLDEYSVLKSLEGTDLPVARGLLLAEKSGASGAFMITTKLPGRTVGKNLIGFEDVANKADMARSIAKLLAQLHRLDPRTIGLLSTSDAISGTERVGRQIDDCQQRWIDNRDRPSLALSLAYRWLKQNLTPEIGGSSLVHGDVSLANILMTGTEVTGLIDWEFAHIGDPAEDLSYCKSVIVAAMDWKEFLAVYTAHGGVDISPARIRFFSVFAKFRLAIMCRISGQLFSQGEVSDPVFAASAVAMAPALETEILSEICQIKL